MEVLFFPHIIILLIAYVAIDHLRYGENSVLSWIVHHEATMSRIALQSKLLRSLLRRPRR